MSLKPLTNILCISGLDPSGGAGIQADIETVSSCGGHALSLCTTLTAQNHRTVECLQPVDLDLLANQFDLLAEEFSIDACKIGLVPNRACAQKIAAFLARLSPTPVVLDPVGIASNGGMLAQQSIAERLQPLLPLCSVLTPNTGEFYQFNTATTHKAQIINALFTSGVKAVLVTGADLETDKVENTLYHSDGSTKLFPWPRLPHAYHGSGCTLSSAIAVFLARGLSIHDAVMEAQLFTWRSLQQAKPAGKQYFPRRISNPATSLIEQKYQHTDE